MCVRRVRLVVGLGPAQAWDVHVRAACAVTGRPLQSVWRRALCVSPCLACGLATGVRVVGVCACDVSNAHGPAEMGECITEWAYHTRLMSPRAVQVAQVEEAGFFEALCLTA